MATSKNQAKPAAAATPVEPIQPAKMRTFIVRIGRMSRIGTVLRLIEPVLDGGTPVALVSLRSSDVQHAVKRMIMRPNSNYRKLHAYKPEWFENIVFGGKIVMLDTPTGRVPADVFTIYKPGANESVTLACKIVDDAANDAVNGRVV